MASKTGTKDAPWKLATPPGTAAFEAYRDPDADPPASWGVLEDWVKATDLPGYGKVLFLMAGTVGLLGGLYWIIEALTQSSVERTHALLKTFSMPYLLVHGLVFTVLFFVYAHQHHIRVW